MPNLRSSKKRMRQSIAHRERNRQQRSQLRSALKEVREATTHDAALAAYRRAEKLLDRAAQKKLVEKNTAARNKSRLSKAVAAKATK